MDYSVTHFYIKAPSEELMQPCRELLADIVGEAAYESFEDTEEGINAYVQTQMYDESLTATLINDFPIDGTDITFTTEEVESEDWNAVWEENGFDPIYVQPTTAAGQARPSCIIYDAKSSNAPELSMEADIAICIEPRMAFGTGAHETTQMIVTELLESDIEGHRFLDCGCGTGILSLVAKRCGASHVTAYDIDEWSVENTKHNAELNSIELKDILLGDVSVLSHVDGMFNIIVANINRNILLADMEQIVETLEPDGKLILSGFYEEDAPMLLSKASTLGLYEASRRTDNGWAMLVLHR